MTNGVRRLGDLPLATVFSTSGHELGPNLGAILFVDPEENAIVPIFIVNIRHTSIKTQKDFDKKLAEGWKVDDYARPLPVERAVTEKKEAKEAKEATEAKEAKEAKEPKEEGKK
ncbi:unnamed protein product, partial [Mesorhabditis spiculigera]